MRTPLRGTFSTVVGPGVPALPSFSDLKSLFRSAFETLSNSGVRASYIWACTLDLGVGTPPYWPEGMMFLAVLLKSFAAAGPASAQARTAAPSGTVGARMARQGSEIDASVTLSLPSPPMSAVAGKREQTKAANRTAILEAARRVFSELGYGAATVRDIVRETDLATGTFYNYFPDKESVLHELFVEGGFRAYYAYLVEDPKTFQMLRRNAGTIRSMFDEPTVGAGVQELRDDLAAGIRSGLLPDHDVEYMAAAMVGAGFEVAVRMLDRDPPDVDAAVAFVTGIFLAGLSS